MLRDSGSAKNPPPPVVCVCVCVCVCPGLREGCSHCIRCTSMGMCKGVCQVCSGTPTLMSQAIMSLCWEPHFKEARRRRPEG